MIEKLRPRLTYANLMSTVAVFLALGTGAAVAASLANDSVKSKHVKNNALKSKDLKNNNLKSKDLKDGKAVAQSDIRGALDGGVIDESSLAIVPAAANATSAATADSATTAGTADSATTAGDADTLDGLDGSVFLRGLARENPVSTANNSDSPKTIIPTCPAGKLLVDVGASVIGARNGSPPNRDTDVVITAIIPEADLSAATVSAEEEVPNPNNWRIQALAVCATAP